MSERVETIAPDAPRHAVCRAVTSSEATTDDRVVALLPLARYPWVKGTLRPFPEVGRRVRRRPRGPAMRR
jgi:hypothetical protein